MFPLTERAIVRDADNINITGIKIPEKGRNKLQSKPDTKVIINIAVFIGFAFLYVK